MFLIYNSCRKNFSAGKEFIWIEEAIPAQAHIRFFLACRGEAARVEMWAELFAVCCSNFLLRQRVLMRLWIVSLHDDHEL